MSSRLLLNFPPVINPVSFSAEFVNGNPNALLFQPDYSSIGSAAAEALANRKLKKPCVVIYGEAQKDSVMAASFNTRAEQLGVKVVLTKLVTRAKSNEVYSTLVEPVKFDKFRNPIEFKIKKDSIGSVFVASDDELIFTKVISSIDRRGDSVIIVGHDSWIEKPSMDLDKFERLHIMMASPSYTDVQSSEFLNFRKRYVFFAGVLPSPIAKTGFECMMFIGQSLRQWGSGFQDGIKQAGPLTGVLGRVYQSSETQCNKRVPFVVFRGGSLQTLDE
jgi:ABC-type branched-subunit amino acid transport system substrate-binding protein